MGTDPLMESRHWRLGRVTRFAAGRWLGRYLVATYAPLGEAEMVLNMLSGLRGANALLVQRRLLERVAASGVAGDQIG